jgi:hypothetical protein
VDLVQDLRHRVIVGVDDPHAPGGGHGLAQIRYAGSEPDLSGILSAPE